MSAVVSMETMMMTDWCEDGSHDISYSGGGGGDTSYNSIW